MARDLVLYDSVISGNAYKIRLLLHQLDIPYRLERLDLLKGEARSDAFRAKNPLGQVPFIVDDGFSLGESNAILTYLGRGSPLCPDSPQAFAQVLQWMFFEQNQLELAIGVSRFVLRFMPELPAAQRDGLIAVHRNRGVNSLKRLEHHLERNEFAVGGRYSIADIALFGYAPLAPEGNFPLDPYPAIRRWIDRVRATPRFIAMDA